MNFYKDFQEKCKRVAEAKPKSVEKEINDFLDWIESLDGIDEDPSDDYPGDCPPTPRGDDKKEFIEFIEIN